MAVFTPLCFGKKQLFQNQTKPAPQALQGIFFIHNPFIREQESLGITMLEGQELGTLPAYTSPICPTRTATPGELQANRYGFNHIVHL